MERGNLVRKLDDLLEIENDSVEKDYNVLACYGLKIDSSGSYIPGSFNISPLLWGIDIIRKYGSQAQNYITNLDYKSDIEKYEKILQNESTINNEVLKTIADEINNDYIVQLLDYQMSYEGILIYSRYVDQRTLEKLDGKSEDLSALSQGYFSEDLLMIKEKIANNEYGSSSQMQKAVLDFITSISEETEISASYSKLRVDIKNNKNELKNWLMPQNLPLGKWPSKYVSALMQQVAINIQISKDDIIKPIFSVNGPPGTGKTTLLKEIIAHNIVERAIMLSGYDTPDDAFVECKFMDGKLSNNGYDKFYYRYYKFKEDEIANYGMLVCSCNNNAVENITRDLPNGNDITSSLKGDKKNDSEFKINGLSEIEHLFNLEKTQRHETYKTKKRISENKYAVEMLDLPDIYFSWLAHRLLTEDEFQEKDFNEWGIISAPLGKRPNINNYCYHVLNPLIDEFLRLNDKRKERVSEFKNYVNLFKEQLEIVKAQGNELIAYSKLEDSYYEKLNYIDKSKSELKVVINNLKETISQFCSDKNNKETIMKDLEDECQVIRNQMEMQDSKLQILIRDLELLKCTRDEISNTIIKMEDSLKLFDKICILFKKETERVSLIKEKRSEKEDIAKRINILSVKTEEETGNYNIFRERYSECKQRIENISMGIQKVKNNIDVKSDILKKKQEEISYLEKIKDDIYQEFYQAISNVKKKVCILDSAFWSDFDSKENDCSTRAQLINPWLSDEYNRSREKLFYLALQVHKEFVLSSTACRDNFINLSMMWQTRNNSADELVTYSKRDREKSFPELLNTLFLFTPVISTTFASVQSFLKDIKEPEKIGLLIVDEAGQAQPQMAVGALYRSKKAIIVGDPKQVEPVVTDDADHIKRVFSDEKIKPYLSKTISVQEFADRINRYGTYIKNKEDNDNGTWVGCPLIVHRRCIEPMFSISNEISYGNSMKIKTILPKEDISKLFLYEYSQWFDVKGKEKDTKGKNHFVEEQGKHVCQLINDSFQKNSGKPDLFIISPFTSVINGMTEMLKSYDALEDFKEELEEWCNDNCGTVHKFQGKEAAEVIFLLGCDINSIGAVKWVNSNIVNVAVTRAKYRIYVVGDFSVWNKSKYLSKVQEYL